MTRKERAAYVSKRLQEIYPAPPIPLRHKDPFTLLVAVLLSARCTDVRVNQITPALFALGDNSRDMARVPVEKIEAVIRPCGLAPAKSKAISGLSKIIHEKHKGRVPQTFPELEALPGDIISRASVFQLLRQ